MADTDDIERRRERDRFRLALRLARWPFVCCCCFCLRLSEARRAKRIFRIVRKETRHWPRAQA